MERMEELKVQSNTELKEEKSKYVLFTPERREECKKQYIKFSKEEGQFERILNKEQRLAAANRRPMPLTF
jgi:hypothetical protein